MQVNREIHNTSKQNASQQMYRQTYFNEFNYENDDGRTEKKKWKQN